MLSSRIFYRLSAYFAENLEERWTHGCGHSEKNHKHGKNAYAFVSCSLSAIVTEFEFSVIQLLNNILRVFVM